MYRMTQQGEYGPRLGILQNHIRNPLLHEYGFQHFPAQRPSQCRTINNTNRLQRSYKPEVQWEFRCSCGPAFFVAPDESFRHGAVRDTIASAVGEHGFEHGELEGVIVALMVV